MNKDDKTRPAKRQPFVPQDKLRPDLIGAKRQPFGKRTCPEAKPKEDKLRPATEGSPCLAGRVCRQAGRRADSHIGDPLGNKARIALGPKVWQRVFASPLYRQTLILLDQIFKRTFDLHDIGITHEEWERIRAPIFSHTPVFLPFCEVILNTEEGKQCCKMEHEKSTARLLATGKIDIIVCHAGLTEIYVPIIFRGKYCGHISIWGGILLHEPNQAEWAQITKRVKNIGVDLERLKKAYFEINPVSKELLDVMLRLLGVIVEEIIRAAVETEEDKKRIVKLESTLRERYHFDKIIGKSQSIQDLFRLLDKVIDSDSPILIEGETGTGKELVAKTIHYHSPRKDGPLNMANCGAFVETLLESEFFGHVKGSFTGAISDKKGILEVTNQGTLFLDEVAEMSLVLQVKLLRVLQEGIFTPVGSTQTRQVDVRVISATNKNLKELVAQGKFREDLYYRLNVIKILLPPLRDRQEDIPLLIDHFIKTNENALKKKITGVSRDALKCLLTYHWPGNVRELQNVLERAIALASSRHITPADLSEEIIKREGPDKIGVALVEIDKPYKEVKRIYQARLDTAFYQEYLSKLLAATKGNVTKAAQQAGVTRATLHNLLKKSHLNPADFRPR